MTHSAGPINDLPVEPALRRISTVGRRVNIYFQNGKEKQP